MSELKEDFVASSNGLGFYVITPISDAAKDWAVDNIEGFEPHDVNVYLDSGSYFYPIIEGILDEGMNVWSNDTDQWVTAENL